MTVSSTVDKSGPYAGSGITGPFVVGFRFLDATHLRVIKTSTESIDTTLAYPTDYSVAGVGNPTGSVTLTLVLAVGEKLTIVRSVPITQEADYVANDSFPAESHETALDKLTMIAQQLSEVQSRALTVAASAPDTDTELPAPESNKLIGWNEAANALQNFDAATLATIVAYGTANSDLFNGTGAQTVFTLTANPGAQANLDVAISGVTQRPGLDYTWSGGTTLTFAVAPPLGTNNILARYMQGLPQGTTDSAASTFIQVGAGAVARTAQNKMREVVSVFDFGAVGDGVADDTSAIQSALVSGASEIVFPRPSAFYKTTSPIRIPMGVKILGQNMRTPFVGTTGKAGPCIKKTTNTTVSITTFDTLIPTARDCIFYIDPASVGGYYPQKVWIEGLSFVGAGPGLVDTAVYFEQGGGLHWSDSDVVNCKHALRARNIWLSRFDGVQAFARFTVEVAGTSCVFINCISGNSANGFDGYHLTGLSYSALIGCASDEAHESAYSLNSCWGLTMIGCGCESPTTAVANAGVALNFGGGNQGVVVSGFFGLIANVAKPIISTGNGDSIIIEGAKFDFGGPVLATDLYAVTFSTVEFRDCFFRDGSKTSPVITFPGANASEVSVFYQGNYKKYTALQTLSDSFVKGTWTPVLSFSFVSAGITYAAQNGTYTIRGNIVTASCTVTLTNKGAAVGSAIISGLPIASAAGSYGSAFVVSQANLGKRCHGQVSSADTSIFLVTEDIATANITNTDFANNTSLILTVTYQI